MVPGWSSTRSFLSFAALACHPVIVMNNSLSVGSHYKIPIDCMSVRLSQVRVSKQFVDSCIASFTRVTEQNLLNV